MSAIAACLPESGRSGIHHLLPFRPFADVHRARQPTGSYRAGKLPVRKRPLADVLSLRHAVSVMWSKPRSAVLLTVFGLTLAVIAISHELTASPKRIRGAVSEGVPGFQCSELSVEVPGGSWNRYSHVMRAALRLPQRCVTDLRNRIKSNPLFKVEHCNVVERCWTRRGKHSTYIFTFYPNYVGFRVEER
jgi:hypothetical protein